MTQSTIARSIEGRALAQQLRSRIRREVDAMAVEHGITPGLAVVLAGGDPASRAYVRNKRRAAAEAGIASHDHDLPETTSQAALLALIRQLNEDAGIHAILVQLPLPAHISSAAVAAAIKPEKDVDGFHEINIGRLWRGETDLSPCTPKACLLLLRQACGDGLAGKHAVVLGRSNIVGKPLANLLLREDCTVTLAHSQTRNLPELCRSADIVVAAMGAPRRVRGHWIKPGAVVIDVGITRGGDALSGKLRLIGDVAFDEVREVAHALTPVPGGVGPMTIACLLDNTLIAACRQCELPGPAEAWAMQARAMTWQLVAPMA
jgi:methylenetetrahydrofolate dehydrogenase (NADP+)/methenyltetrahydrofolate cyclohydrolase